MSDLTQKLRGLDTYGYQSQLACQAADEIERLRAAIRAALNAPMIDHSDRSRSAYGILEAALKVQP